MTHCDNKLIFDDMCKFSNALEKILEDLVMKIWKLKDYFNQNTSTLCVMVL